MNVAHPVVRVYLVEDSPILTKLLVGLIEADSGAIVVGQTDNARSALADIRSLDPGRADKKSFRIEDSGLSLQNRLDIHHRRAVDCLDPLHLET